MTGLPEDGRTREACREIADLIEFFLPQLHQGDIRDTLSICRVRLALLAERRFGPDWRSRPILHLLDANGVPWCLTENFTEGADEETGELCPVCLAAMELVATAWEH